MRYIYIIPVFLFGFMSCNNATNTSGTATTDSAKTKPVANAQPVQSKLSAEGTAKLMTMINAYYSLKDALVATNSSSADGAGIKLRSATDSMRSYLEKRDTLYLASLQRYLDTIRTQSKVGFSSYDEDCIKKRIAFASISSAMYGLLKNVGIKNTVIYQEHCPMAMEEKGADWLSDDSDIKNPYFGKKMIECGEVTDVIK